MSRNIRRDKSVLENVLSLVEALVQLSVEQDCELKLPLCVVWEADKLRITGYEIKKTTGNRTKTTEVGTTKEYLLNQIKDAGKSLKLPPQKAQPNVSQKKRELDELQTALDWLKELGVREDEPARKNQGYWKFTLTLKDQKGKIKDPLEVVKQKWKEYGETNLQETFQVQTTDNSFDWQEKCRAMLEKHKRLTTDELLFADDEMKFELEAIHVPLALVERNKPKKCSEDISAEQGSRFYEPSDEDKEKKLKHKDFLEQVIRDGVGKTQGHRIALIGEPGAGKTTQLQTIAFWILDNNLGLPIWIYLADLQKKSVENYLLQDWLKNALEVVRVKEEQENAFADLFKNNRVWLLLDAADEMSSLQPLTEISQQLTGWVKNARVVLTCRVNVWEANAGALENFETYRLLNFEYPQDVQKFIRRWFHNKDADKGERLWQELDKPERQRIQDLVKNPLRLALLCSTWQGSDKGLPETKAGLYQQFLEEVYKWKDKRFPTTEEQQEELNAALGRLAKRAIDQETSRFRLRHKFVREELGDPKQQNSLFWLALKLGWLNEVGLAAESAKEKVYAFYHPTFEEYFAALAIADWHEFLNHVPDNPALGVYRIFAPQWKEVILLWLGREDVARKEKEEFIQALVEFDDGCGEFSVIDKVRRGFYEFRAYFLAAAGVDEWKNSVNADAIVAEIVKWGFGEFKVEQNECVEFLTPIPEGAETALSQTNRIKAIAALVELIGNPQLDDFTRYQAAERLGKIGSGNQKAIDALVELIGNPQLANYTRWEAAYSLEEIGSGNQKAIDALVKLIGKPQLDDDIRKQAAESLGEIDPGNQKAIDALVELIGNPQLDDDTRKQAAVSLRRTYSGNQKAIDALVELIGNPQLDDDTRRLVAESLEEIDSGNQKAIDVLVVLINKPQLNDDTRKQAAESLEKIGSDNQKAIDALVELIGKPQLDHTIRKQVAESLGQIGYGSQKAIDALVELISNPQFDDDTRKQAAKSLNKIGYGSQKAIDALVELIGKPQLDDDTRKRAAESLGEIGYGSQKAIDALVELIGHTIRKQVAESLGRIGYGNQKAIDTLVELIGKPQLDYGIQLQVGKSLEKIGYGNQKAINALVDLIGNPQLDHTIRWRAAYNLGKIGPDNQEAIDALVELIGKPQLDDDTRWRAAESLIQIDSGNEKAIDALVELIGKPQLDDDIRRKTASSLGQIGSGDEKAIDALVELIGKPQLYYFAQTEAVSSLGKIGSGNQKAIDALVELIDERELDDYTSLQGAYSLGQIGSGNEKAIDALVKLIGKPRNYVIYSEQLDDDTLWQAIESLGQIGSGNEKAIDALVELIGKPQLDDDTRRLAAYSLGQIGSGNEKAIDALVELIGNPQLDDDTRWQAAYSLGEIDPGNQEAIDALLELIGNPQLDDDTRRQAIESLGQIGSGNQTAIDALVELIGKPQLDDDTRWQAVYNLRQIDSGNQKAIDALVKLIGNPQLDDDTRKQVASSLGRIDPGNQKAIAALIELIGKPQLDDNTRSEVASSLEKIMLKEQMPSVVSVLKNYLSPETYKNDFKQFDNCYKVIWKCAQSMPYPAFYQAWHQQE